MSDFTDVERELAALYTLLKGRAQREPIERYVSTAADVAPARRLRIDTKLTALGTDSEADVLGDEGLLGLIADLVEYRVALWEPFDGPIPYEVVGDEDDVWAGEFPPYVDPGTGKPFVDPDTGLPPFVIKHQGSAEKKDIHQ